MRTINRTTSGIETPDLSCHKPAYSFLSIAPSLELKHLISLLPAPMIPAINRTISGIETVLKLRSVLCDFCYQSHHLWN